MAKVGGYEIIKELHRGPLASIFLVRRAGGGGVGGGGGGPADAEGVLAMKICRPPAEVLGDEPAARVVEDFLAAAEIQQLAAGGGGTEIGASRWLGVHEVGKASKGAVGDAFIVTDLAVRGPVSKLVSGSARVDEAALHNIAGSVVAGLMKLRASCGRAHGALRASNVLLMDDQPPSLSRVVLTDPAPASMLGADPFSQDLRALGRLLYALVMHREHGGGWPLSPSAMWNAVERDSSGRGQAWRELTNRLLDPSLRDKEGQGARGAEAGWPLQEVAAAIDALAPRTVKAKKKAVVATVAAAALVLGGVGGYMLFGRSREAVVDPALLSEKRWLEEPQAQERWQTVCDDYYNWLWSLTKLDRRVEVNVAEGIPQGTRRELLTAVAPDVVEQLTQFGEGGEHPGVIAGLKDKEPDFRALRGAPTVAARSDAGVKRTEQLQVRIGGLKQFLADKWPGAALVKQSAADFATRGWSRAANRAQGLADGLGKSAEHGENLGNAIDELAGAQPALRRIKESRERIAAAASEIANTHDPVLAKFAAEADRLIGRGLAPSSSADPLDELAAQSAKVDALGKRLAEYARTQWKNIDSEELFRSEEHRALAAVGSPDIAAFESWITIADRYPALPKDQNPVPAVMTLLGKLDDVVAQYDREIGTARPMDEATKSTVGQYRTRAQTLSQLGWVQKNRDRIESESKSLSLDITRMSDRVAGEIEDFKSNAAKSLEQIVSKLRTTDSISPHSRAIDVEWRTRRDKLLSEAGTAGKEQVAASAKQLQSALLELDGLIALPPARAEKAPAWRVKFNDAIVSEREKWVGQSLATLASKPLGSSADIALAARPAIDGFGAWAENAAKLHGLLGEIEKHFQNGYGLAGKPTGQADAKSVESIWSEAQANPAMKDERIAAAAALLGTRVDRLKRTLTETDAAKLVQTIDESTNEQPENALAAWERLGTDQIGWPKSSDDLSRTATVRKTIEDRVRGAAMDSGRRDELLRGLTSEGVRRWNRFAARGADPTSGDATARERMLVSAFDAAEPLGVTEQLITDPRVRYAYFLRRLQKSVEHADDAAAATAAGAFANSARSLPTEVSSRKPVADLVSAMSAFGQSRRDDPPGVDPKTLGPARKQLTPTSEAEDRILSFDIGGLKVRFLRVEFDRPGFGPDVVYLGEDEVSLALFEKLLSMKGLKRDQFFDLVSDMEREGGWPGPRAWDWREGGTFQPSRYWVESQSVYQSTAAAYAGPFAADPPRSRPNATGRGLLDTAGGEPKSTHPMQRVSAKAAASAAEAIGCRLPTAAEWKAAYQQFGSGPESQWNLRDRTFQQQNAYIDQLRRGAGANFLDFYTPPDQFSYQPARPGAGSRDFDDGVLWFRPVDAGTQPVKNLVGNVAEFVYLATGQIPDVPSSTEPVGAIGGSALSDSTAPIDQARPIEVTTNSFADVGLRLAFAATGSKPKPKPLAEQISQRLRDERLLLD